ncbi:MAG: hypothetical protein JSV01_01980 [Desulfobacterales bacterium]|nr:MAG: hypothetical protein JSV01_01980 [Desulfobacterales bacterium]
MKIQSYRFGYIQIDGKDYRNDVKLIGKSVVPEWWRSQGHLVQINDVQDLLNADAEICVFGTGAYGSMRVSEAVRSEFQNRGIQILIEKTESACDTYSRLLRDGKKVVAGFHLIC